MSKEYEAESQTDDLLQTFSDLLRHGTLAQVGRELHTLHPAEIAHLLEALPHEERDIVWDLVQAELDGDVLLHVNDDVRARLIRDMDSSELLAAAEGLETDDLADILSDFPQDVTGQVLEAMDEQRRQRLQNVMGYPEDTAGGLMNTDTITVRPDLSLDVVQRYLRRIGQIPQATDKLIVIDRDGKYLGLIPLTDLLVRDPNTLVSELMDTSLDAIPATLSEREVARLFERRDLVSAPVVDEAGRLLGRT